MNKVFVFLILAIIVTGGVFGQIDSGSFIYNWEQYLGRNETPSGIHPEGAIVTTPANRVHTRSTGVYEYYDCYLVGSFGRVGSDPGQYGPLIDKNGKRSYPNLSKGTIRLDWGKYPIIHTGENQTIAILTSRIPNFWTLEWSTNTRLLLIKQNTKVEFNSDGLKLISGEITEDKNIKQASSLDETMSMYSTVMGNDDLFGMSSAYAVAKGLSDTNDPATVADWIVKGYATGMTAFSAVSGVMMPIWLLPAEFANSVATNCAKAQMAYAISLAYGQKPDSEDEFKYDLYVLLAGEDVQALLRSTLKAAGISVGTELLSKEIVLEKIASASTVGIQTVTNRIDSMKVFQSAIMKTDIAKKVGSKLTVKGIAKAIPIVASLVFAGMDGMEAHEFGKMAMQYYTLKASEGEVELPTNVNVAFQSARYASRGFSGFLTPDSANPKNNTAIQLEDMTSDELTLPHRLFKLEHLGNGWYRIKNNKFGVLDVPGDEDKKNLQMVLYQQGDDQENQRFRIVSVGNGEYQIYTHYGKNLHARSDWFGDTIRVVTRAGSPRDRDPNQNWRIYTVNDKGWITRYGSSDDEGGGLFSDLIDDITGKIKDFFGINDPVDPATLTLNGSWSREDNNTIYTFNNNSGVFTRIGSGFSSLFSTGMDDLYKDAERKRFINIGDQCIRNLTRTGDFTWTGEIKLVTFRGSSEATGTMWERFTITLSADSGSFVCHAPGSTWIDMTFTKTKR